MWIKIKTFLTSHHLLNIKYKTFFSIAVFFFIIYCMYIVSQFFTIIHTFLCAHTEICFDKHSLIGSKCVSTQLLYRQNTFYLRSEPYIINIYLYLYQKQKTGSRSLLVTQLQFLNRISLLTLQHILMNVSINFVE